MAERYCRGSRIPRAQPSLRLNELHLILHPREFLALHQGSCWQYYPGS